MKLCRLIIVCLNENYRKDLRCIGKHLSDVFSIQDGLKQVDALSQMLFYFAIQYATVKV
jgi:hypothetical protein